MKCFCVLFPMEKENRKLLFLPSRFQVFSKKLLKLKKSDFHLSAFLATLPVNSFLLLLVPSWFSKGLMIFSYLYAPWLTQVLPQRTRQLGPNGLLMVTLVRGLRGRCWGVKRAQLLSQWFISFEISAPSWHSAHTVFCFQKTLWCIQACRCL